MGDDPFQRVHERLDDLLKVQTANHLELMTKQAETHTALFTKGGVVERIENVEKKIEKQTETLSGIKTKIAIVSAGLATVMHFGASKIAALFSGKE